MMHFASSDAGIAVQIVEGGRGEMPGEACTYDKGYEEKQT